jgi:hypothetical protein
MKTPKPETKQEAISRLSKEVRECKSRSARRALFDILEKLTGHEEKNLKPASGRYFRKRMKSFSELFEDPEHWS